MAQTARTETDKVVTTARDAAGNVAELGKHAADKGADMTRETMDRAEDATRGGLETARKVTDAASEVERAIARRSAEGASELTKVFADLLGQQTRDGVEAFRSLTRTIDWDAAAKIQGEFMRLSLERSVDFTRRYVEVVQAILTTAASTTWDQARKAA